MTLLGTLHLSAAVLALLTGASVLSRRKGTRLHRRTGWVYAVSMLTLNVTALLIYRLTGYFGPFHAAALVSFATIVAGIVPAWRRLPKGRWLERHYFFMTYSYLGLLAAAVAETATRVPALRPGAGGPSRLFWGAVVLTTVAVFVVGARMIRSRVHATLTPFQHRMAAETRGGG